LNRLIICALSLNGANIVNNANFGKYIVEESISDFKALATSIDHLLRILKGQLISIELRCKISLFMTSTSIQQNYHTFFWQISSPHSWVSHTSLSQTTSEQNLFSQGCMHGNLFRIGIFLTHTLKLSSKFFLFEIKTSNWCDGKQL
jgi:hypothetical protein